MEVLNLKPYFPLFFWGGMGGNSNTSAVSIQHQAAWKSWCRQAVATSTMNPWCNTSRWMRRSPRGQNHEVTPEDQGYLEFQNAGENTKFFGQHFFCGCFFFFLWILKAKQRKAKKTLEGWVGISSLLQSKKPFRCLDFACKRCKREKYPNRFSQMVGGDGDFYHM